MYVYMLFILKQESKQNREMDWEEKDRENEPLAIT